MKTPVSHYINGSHAWNIGLVGALLRVRWLALNAILALLTASIPWLWPEDLSAHHDIRLNVPVSIAIAGTICGILWMLSLVYLRKRTRRSLDMKHLLHQLTHRTRDRHTKLHKLLVDHDMYRSDSVLKEELDQMAAELCQCLAEFFRRLLYDDSIAASIRLAVPDVISGQVVYKTKARWTGMNPMEHEALKTTISANEGIPLFFRGDKEAQQGVLVYHDLKAAAAMGAYDEMRESDQSFLNNIAAMMVAPLNAWCGDEAKQDLIGLLYITSRKKGAFRLSHVDSILFLADHTAVAISNVVTLIQSKQRIASNY